MSECRSMKQRRSRQTPPTMVINAEVIGQSADAVLNVDLSDVAFHTRAGQVIVGLCRAGFAQSKVISTLAKAGLLSAAAPNQRLILEIALRLHWLLGLPQPERRTAVDTVLAKDRQDMNRQLAYLREVGHEADFDPAEMDAFELAHETKGAIHQQVTRLRAAVESSEVTPWSLYAMWLGETKLAHASGSLAGSYAPTLDDLHMLSGAPEIADPDLEAHRLVQTLIVMLTGALLIEEGMPEEFASRIGGAFFAV